MLPNRFADRGEAPEFNAVDASLWFVVAVHDLLRRRRARAARACTRARSRARSQRAVDAIVDGYARGHALRHPRRRRRPARCRRARRAADMDGREGRRLRRHAAHRQAGRGPGAVAERALQSPPTLAARWATLLRRAAGVSFEARFWNDATGCLYDVVDVDHEPGTRRRRRSGRTRSSRVGGLPSRSSTASARAASSTRSSASCWTPLGLRSLAPASPATGALRGRRRRARRRLSPGHRVAVAHRRRSSTRGCACTAATPTARGSARRASSRRSLAHLDDARPRPCLGDRRRRAAAHAARLPVPGVVGRRSCCGSTVSFSPPLPSRRVTLGALGHRSAWRNG